MTCPHKPERTYSETTGNAFPKKGTKAMKIEQMLSPKDKKLLDAYEQEMLREVWEEVDRVDECEKLLLEKRLAFAQADIRDLQGVNANWKRLYKGLMEERDQLLNENRYLREKLNIEID